MTYIDELAEAIRRRIPPNFLPEGGTSALFRIYAVLALARGEDVSVEDVHNAWCAWMAGLNPDHPSLKPLSELSAEVARADQPFVDAIRAVVREGFH